MSRDNRLGFLRNSGSRGLAGALLLVLQSTMSACIFPQDDNVIDDLPPRLNQRPSVDYNSVYPPLDFDQMRNGANCGPYSFRVSVQDPDLEDRIYLRIYVDYDPSRVLYNDAGVPVGDSNYVKVWDYDRSPTARRQPTYTFDFTPNRSDDPLKDLGRHVIQVGVADGIVLPGRQVLQPTAPDGSPLYLPDGGLPDPRYIDLSLRWVVDVVAGDCP